MRRHLVSGTTLAGRNALGVGMIEVMLALLIFATAMAGIVAAQLTGRMAAHEALQRSMAALLAGDLLERVRGNPGQLARYGARSLGDITSPLSRPTMDCSVDICSSEQLAHYDVWQWESQLLGEAEREGEYRLGGLLQARACIQVTASDITLGLSWRGPLPSKSPTDFACGESGNSGDTGADIYDAPGYPTGNKLLRRVLTVSTAVMAVP